ncbi:MAG: DUF1801 domain-containing protein [Rudaea sp.]|nr:DUF1801 domain-containing protein [Rudaea sp.]
MAGNASRTKSAGSAAAASASVETFLARLDHPLKPAILALRKIILAAEPAIAEGIKWNAPSFRTSEYFATFHLGAKDGLQVILHVGAKARDVSISAGAIADPQALLEWLGKDRATVKFRDVKDIKAKQAAFAAIVRQWIKFV